MQVFMKYVDVHIMPSCGKNNKDFSLKTEDIDFNS